MQDTSRPVRRHRGLQTLIKFSSFFLAPLPFASAIGQAANPPSPFPTLHLATDLIQVPVLALKVPFRPAPGLLRQDFTISLDGGAPFHPTYARIEGSEPLSLGILVESDTRLTVLLSKSLSDAVQAWPASLFTDSDRLSWFTFGCSLVQSLHNAPGTLSRERDNILRSLSDSMQAAAAAEGTKPCERLPLEKALKVAIEQIASNSSSCWKVILLLTNGDEKARPRQLDAIQPIAAAAGVTLLVVKYLPPDSFPASVYSDNETINLLASSLGGVSIASSFDDLGSATTTMIGSIRGRYILSFPLPGNGVGGAHRIQVTTRARGVRVFPSASSAPLFDSSRCSAVDATWSCTEQRPQYGNSDHPK